MKVGYIFIILTILIIFLICYQTKSNYVYLQPGCPPTVIAWNDPRAQKII